MKSKLKNLQLTVGSWITLTDPAIAEILALQGYKWVVIDNEHSMMSLETIQSLIVAAQGKGADTIVRLSHNHDSEVRKILDAGATGVMCPMINSKSDAKKLVDAAKYPPTGQRTYGLARAQAYGSNSADYFSQANEQTVVIAQIEHIDGVRNIDEILDTPGLDGILTGPYDLSGSLMVPGQLTHPEVIRAEERVIAACKKKRIACGAHLVHPTEESIQQKLKMGYSFLALGTDFHFLSQGAKVARVTIEKLLS